jgi:Arrestin (or S-antigen), N-terminal domain
MSVRIQFDKPNACHTNLDFVTGRVILILQSDTTVQAITVKLEGESKTRLAGPRSTNAERNDKQKVELEIHKVRKWCCWIIMSITELALIYCHSCYTKF